jgi:type IV pilus assembly protein PilN
VIKINLAPPTTKTRRETGSGINLGAIFGGLTLLLLVAVGAYWWTLSSDVSAIRQELAQNQAEVARLKPIIAEGQRYRREKEELERRVNAIEAVARNQARPTYLMEALSGTLPADLWLTRVEEKGAQLRLAGTTYSSVALSDFMANLKSTGRFKDVDLIESRQDLTKSPRTITFEVACRFEI